MTFSMNHLGNNGSLGNQMFQYAFLKSMSVKHNVPFCIPPTEVFGKHYYQKLFSNIDECFDIKCPRRLVDSVSVIEKHFHFDQDMYENPPGKDINYYGFFQSERYFKDISDELRNNDFKFNDDIIEDCEPIVSEYKDSISLHIRRNDYLTNGNHPVQPIKYYISALSKMPKELPVLIFSDDPEWCKEQKIFDGDRFLISETDNPYFDLYIMTKCKYHIIANSSYSWWGAWLANSRNVIAPKIWFSGEIASNDTKDLYLKHWKVI
jgi:hypothetical protein